MCLQIAKCQLLCYNLILFIAAHLSHLLSDFSTPDWCSVTLSSIWPQRWRHAVINLMALPICSVHIIIIIFCCFQVVWEAEWAVLFDFFMHVMLRYEFAVSGYNELLLHLCVSSTLVNHGDKVFHYPPTASYSCLFKPHKGMSAGCSGMPAQRVLQLRGHPNKILGVGFLPGKEAWPVHPHVTEALPGRDGFWIYVQHPHHLVWTVVNLCSVESKQLGRFHSN